MTLKLSLGQRLEYKKQQSICKTENWSTLAPKAGAVNADSDAECRPEEAVADIGSSSWWKSSRITSRRRRGGQKAGQLTG